MTADEVLDGLIAREGGWRDAVQRPNGSWDPATNLGITLDTLQTHGPSLLAPAGGFGIDRLRALTADEAGVIYRAVYIERPGFTPANIPFEPLRVQLIDFGVNSGPERAVRWLQRVLQTDATGVLDEGTHQTLDFVQQIHDKAAPLLNVYALINDALVAARSYMIDQLEDHGQLRSADEEGVESRALSFFLARPS